MNCPCNCDSSELDDLLIDWEAKAKVMHRAIAARESLIARLTLAQIPPTDILACAHLPSTSTCGPSGL